MVTMISKAPTTVSGVSAWYSAANPCTRATLAAASCSPRMPSPGKVGVPYRATIRRPGKSTCPPPGSSTPVAAVQPTATIGIGSGFGVSDTLAWKIATAAIAWMSAGSTRGSPLLTTMTSRPAARAVATAASSLGSPVVRTRPPSGVSASSVSGSAGAAGDSVGLGVGSLGRPVSPAPTSSPLAVPSSGAGETGRPSDPTGSPTESPAAPALPLTELAETPDGGLVLTTGDPTELAAVATARAAALDVIVVSSGDPRVDPADIQAIAAVQPTASIGIGSGFGVSDTLAWKVAAAATGVELPGGGQVLFPGRRMVALYGTPTFPGLGILGEQDPAASVARVQALAAECQALTPDTVVGAFEIIVTIASAGPGEDGNYSNELPVETLIPWVEAARDAGVYVVLDLQPGRTDFLTQAKLYEPLLLYPNVGLAMDPA